MRVYFSADAEAELERIGDYIAKENPMRAVTFIQELRRRAMDLAGMPLAFPIVSRYDRQAIRRRVHGNYAIFHTVVGEDVFILHVLHGARDYETILS